MEKGIVIIDGAPTPKEWETINDLAAKGYYAATNLPPGITWEKRDI
jgi:hypothetical protein